MVETRNAIITSAAITNDDYGLLSAWIMLDYGGSGQGFGGYALYLPKTFRHATVCPDFAGHFLWRVMEVADVREWGHLPGKTVRVRYEHSKVHALGHIVKDDWFDPRVEFDEMQKGVLVREDGATHRELPREA